MTDETLFETVQPFSGDLPVPVQESGGALVEAAIQREIAEVQAAMAIAKRFPRNQKQAFDRIMLACQRPSLAEEALFSYSRGGTEITGPSIRLAEAIIQQWGNADFGIKEVDQRNGESTVLAYAWDLETNTRQTKTFQVKHKRFTKQGSYTLEDPRDIYEMVANLGARRLRACILGVIPGDIVSAAQSECEKTLKTKADNSPETVKKMVEKFGEFGVSKAQIEKRIQRNLDSITPAQMVSMRKIYNSMKDGMSKPDDWFEAVEVHVPKDEPKKERKKAKKEEPEVASGAALSVGMVDSTGTQIDPETAPPHNLSKPISPEHVEKIRFLLKSKPLDESMVCQEYEVEKLEDLTWEAGLNVMEWLAKVK